LSTTMYTVQAWNASRLLLEADAGEAGVNVDPPETALLR
jgi:hypothetical protein